jgi:hypothetical protein
MRPRGPLRGDLGTDDWRCLLDFYSVIVEEPILRRPKMEVRWDDPKVQARYEDMVSTLVKRLHPDAQRVDGSGGDDGRDVQIPSPCRPDYL